MNPKNIHRALTQINVGLICFLSPEAISHTSHIKTTRMTKMSLPSVITPPKELGSLPFMRMTTILGKNSRLVTRARVHEPNSRLRFDTDIKDSARAYRAF